MQKIPFSLDEWLKDKSREVVNAEGARARIVQEPMFFSEDRKVIGPYKIATPGHSFSVIGSGILPQYFILSN